MWEFIIHDGIYLYIYAAINVAQSTAFCSECVMLHLWAICGLKYNWLLSIWTSNEVTQRNKIILVYPIINNLFIINYFWNNQWPQCQHKKPIWDLLLRERLILVRRLNKLPWSATLSMRNDCSESGLTYRQHLPTLFAAFFSLCRQIPGSSLN
jgi:hypothetical protein